jgi:tetratricopeptide (TPR) repeat protein
MKLKLDTSVLPSSNTAPATRASEIINLVKQRSGGLEELEMVLDEVLSGEIPTPGPSYPSGILIIVIVIIMIIIVFLVYLKEELEKKRIEKELFFKKNEHGILVANFASGNDVSSEREEGQNFAHKIFAGLREKIETAQGKGVVVKRIDPKIRPFLKTDGDAIDIGKTYGARLVIWGEISRHKNGNIISSTIQPIKYEKERYDLGRVSSDLSPRIEFKDAAERVEEDVQKLVYFILGYSYYMRGKDEQALKLAEDFFNKALLEEKEIKNDAYTHLYLGNISHFRYKNEKDDTPIREYKKALELNPDLMEAYNNLGLISLEREQIEEALDNLNKAYTRGECSTLLEKSKQERSLNPGCAHVMYNLGTGYVKKKDYENAIKYYQEFLKAFERVQEGFDKAFLVRANNGIGFSYIEKAEYEKAKEYLSKAITILEEESASLPPEELKDLRAPLNRNLGKTYLELKNWNLALKCLSKAKEDDDKNPRVYLLLFQVYNQRCEKGDLSKAMTSRTEYLNMRYNQEKGSEADAKLQDELKITCKEH